MKSIRSKLLASLLGMTLVTVIGMYAFIQWSFDRGFTEYVQQQELNRLAPLTTTLAEHYRQQESWEQFSNDDGAWRRIHRVALQLGGQYGPAPRRDGEARRPPRDRPPREGPRDGPERRPPPGEFSGTEPGGSNNLSDLPRRLSLLDAQGRWIAGERAGQLDDAGPTDNAQLPIELDGVVVGFLGIAKSKDVKNRLDQGFVQSQNKTALIISITMLVLAIAVSLPLAAHLVKPLRALVEGTRELAAGNHQARISVSTNDELGQLTSDFNHLAATLEANERARHQWIADISHELRTPIAVIKAQIEALIDGVRSPSPEVLRSLENHTSQLSLLVDDLYQLSLSDMGALDYRKEFVSLKVELEDLKDSHHGSMKHTGIDIELNTAQLSDDKLFADPARLRQLFENLVINSQRYTDAPGILQITARNTDAGIEVLFNDSPPGVSTADLPQLFDRLFRGDRSRNRAKGGAGLGLSLCRSIVESHHGTISAAPSSLGGLEVRIILNSKASGTNKT